MRKKQLGVNVLEMMFVLSLTSVLSAMAGPAYTQIVQANQRSAASIELFSELNLARSEAIKRNRNVYMCALSKDADLEKPKCDFSANGDWSNGWLIFVDHDNQISGSEPQLDDEVITVRNTVANRYSLQLDADQNWLRFGAIGNANGSSEFALCAQDNDEMGRRIAVKAVGSIRIEKNACALA